MTNKEAIEELESLIEHCYSFLDHKHHEPWESDIEALKLGIEALKERSQGEWIKDDWYDLVCSNCGGVRRDHRVDHINYCNKCGADMRGGAE